MGNHQEEIIKRNPNVHFCEDGDHEFNWMPVMSDVVAILPSGKLVVELPVPMQSVPVKLCIRVSLDRPVEGTPEVGHVTQDVESEYQTLMGKALAQRVVG